MKIFTLTRLKLILERHEWIKGIYEQRLYYLGQFRLDWADLWLELLTFPCLLLELSLQFLGPLDRYVTVSLHLGEGLLVLVKLSPTTGEFNAIIFLNNIFNIFWISPSFLKLVHGPYSDNKIKI